MPNLLIHLAPKPGYNNVFEMGAYKMQLTRFGIVRLTEGDSLTGEIGEREAALVILGGKLAVHGDGFDFGDVGCRKNVFDGAPHTVYFPRRTRYTVTALTNVEYALIESPASRDTAAPCVIPPAQTRTFEIGRDNFKRSATVMIDEKFNSEHFYVGEGMVPSGNWSGYPPHRHDYDNPPEEIDMEETYFYRFNPVGGFGIQKVYQPDGSLDETYTVKNNDTVAISEGFHPLCCAPGYQMYYLWAMAGRVNRGLISYKDPAHCQVK